MRVIELSDAEFHRLQVEEGPRNVMKHYGDLVAKNKKLGGEAIQRQQRGELAREMSALFAREITRRRDIMDMPLCAMQGDGAALEAATAADTVGTLSGTLVMQKALELFRINYPLFKAVYMDFSDEPIKLNQTVSTRIVGKPAVQTYDPTLGADNRPLGWKTVSPASTTDVNNRADEHIGVPIVFDASTLASTVRNLFQEQAPAVAYAIASYFVAKIYALMTPANFNAYAAINGAKVPVAYATYAKNVGDFARSAVVDLNAIFNPNEVPLHDRALLLNSAYYAAVGKDPSLITFWAAQRNPELITEGELPKMSKFVPIEAPDFPSTNNRVGMALQKNAVIAIARLPIDYTKVLPGSSYGNVATVIDAETGLSMMVVEYVNHTGGYAEMRGEAVIGAGVGDKRGGLVLTGQ